MDITTRGGQGPWLSKAEGTFVYRPLPIYPSRDFYSPKYRLADASPTTADMRSTLFWDANMVTDEEGKSFVSFYASDRAAGTYTIRIEGTDLLGRFGFKKQTIRIRPAEAAK